MFAFNPFPGNQEELDPVVERFLKTSVDVAETGRFTVRFTERSYEK